MTLLGYNPLPGRDLAGGFRLIPVTTLLSPPAAPCRRLIRGRQNNRPKPVMGIFLILSSPF